MQRGLKGLRMKQRLRYGGWRFGAFGAGIAIFCAVFFIVSTIAHVALHAYQPLPSSVAELSSPGDEHGNGAIDGAMDATHCHGCSAVSAPAFVNLLELTAVSSATKIVEAEMAPQSSRLFDPPPPKS
jgi:hypothetical protein